MTDEQMGEIKRFFGVVAEDLRGEIRQVAEGHDVLRGEIRDLRGEMQEGFREMKTLLRVSYEGFDRRLSTVEGRVDALESRVPSPKQ